MRSVTKTGITDSVQVVAVSCDAIVRWSIVYDFYEVPNPGGIPTAALWVHSVMPTTAELAKKIAALEALLNEKLDTLIDDLVSRINIKLQNMGLGEHASLCESVQYISKEFDTMKQKQEELVASNKALLSRNEALEKRVADLEQYSRMNNVEIKGIPSSQGEDCIAILKQIGDAIEYPISPTDIDTAHRVASRSSDKSIIARFCSRDKKNEFIRKARRARLRTDHVGFTGSTNMPIYVNDHLTIDNKKLF
ncbi:hypothetical protein HPB50_028262 [Hyalomma asiaticum]|nr:hypothetical protein HPB50_028262 [Hyalomma asiaticum]